MKSDYVPGSILDLWILCLWMDPLTSVDDETLSLISSLHFQKLFRGSVMRRKTHKSPGTLIIKMRMLHDSVCPQPFPVALWRICFLSALDMYFGRGVFFFFLFLIPVWQEEKKGFPEWPQVLSLPGKLQPETEEWRAALSAVKLILLCIRPNWLFSWNSLAQHGPGTI